MNDIVMYIFVSLVISMLAIFVVWIGYLAISSIWDDINERRRK